MKKIYLAAAVIAAFTFLGSGCWQKPQSEISQTDTLTKPDSTEAVQMKPDLDTWNEFSTVEGGFSILMPRAPVIKRQIVDTWAGALDEFSFTADTNGVRYQVSYHDYELSDIKANDPQMFLDSAMATLAKSGQVREEKMISMARHPGRELKLVSGTDTVFARMFLARERLYRITLAGPRQDSSSVQKFLGSFKLI